uniref:RNA/RNP complex-1-interacting phosphatase n=1 Tax=Magallana gigas TaxID=29159 RepID=K1PZ87_MAGGI
MSRLATLYFFFEAESILRWEKYQALGKELCEKLPEDEQFTPKKLVAMVSEQGHRLGMVVDLTFTKKYYAAFEFKGQGVRHEKIFTEGHNVPNDDVVYRFFDTLESFFKECQDENQVVGVHCTHGINRTGYVVCRYMIERLGFNADKAMAVYHEARGYPIERENYIEDLRLRHLNRDYKYEGREKLPMQKHQQNRRPYQNREHEQEYHQNHRQHEEEYHERSRSHDIEHRREHHGQEYRNHRHNNRDRDYSAGFDLHRDMHHPQYPAKSYNRHSNQPWSQDQRDYHPPRGNHHWNSQSGDQQNRTRSAGRFQNFSDRRRFNNRADYDDDWRQSHIEIHDDNLVNIMSEMVEIEDNTKGMGHIEVKEVGRIGQGIIGLIIDIQKTIRKGEIAVGMIYQFHQIEDGSKSDLHKTMEIKDDLIVSSQRE